MCRLVLAVVSFSVLAMMVSCGENPPQIPPNKMPKNVEANSLMYANQAFVELELEEIDAYIDSLKLNFEKSGSGLRYRIIKPGARKLVPKDEAVINYSVYLLDGSSCSELTNKERKIRIDKGMIERGIEEAVELLGAGGSGEFIIPSFLAYGVSGYKNCIPSRTPVRCEICVTSVR